MSISTEDKTEAVPDWAIGYSLSLPCENKTPKCDNEAEWFGNQHGCVEAYLCDEHMMQAYRLVNEDIAEYGHVNCARCRYQFPTFESFIKAVRI